MASEPKHWSDVPERRSSSNNRFVSGAVTRGRRVWDSLVYSSAYLALIAVAKVLIVTYVLSLPLSPAPIVAGLGTFAIYANDRIVDAETDVVSKSRRTVFVRRHRRLLYVLGAIAYGLAVALSVFGGPVAFGLTLLPGGIWILYALDWMPSDVRFQRLKDLLIVNSLLVAIAWSLAVVFLPVVFADAPLTPAVGVVFAYFFLGTFVNAEISNVSDLESDRQNGVATMPLAFGVHRTRQILYALTLLVVGVLGYAAFSDYLTATIAAALAVGPVCLMGILSLLGRVDDSSPLTVASECTRLPVFVAVFAFVV